MAIFGLYSNSKSAGNRLRWQPEALPEALLGEFAAPWRAVQKNLTFFCDFN